MADYTLSQYLPLVSVGVWWSLAVYQVARDRFRTWTEVFFLGQCLFLGGYSFSDVLFFTAPNKAQAATAALASFSTLTLAGLFIMLFGVVFYTRMRRSLFLTIIPSLVLLPVLWANLIPDVNQDIIGIADPGDPNFGPPWVGEWNTGIYVVWIFVVFLYVLVGSLALLMTYRQVARQTTQLKRRMQLLLLSALIAVILSVFTNALRGVLGLRTLPLFSSALALPGAVTWAALSPLTKERFSVAVRRWKARRYEIKMAFLIYTDGTLIGSEIEAGEKIIDKDLFTATLDVIQNFMRTSFPALRGKWLQSIRHGDYTLVIERGKWIYLVLVIHGEESDQLRRQMRDALLSYEGDNRAVLHQWRGVPSDAKGTSTLLLSLLEGK